jgi:orotidine-5'-phosphate decarboxylase
LTVHASGGAAMVAAATEAAGPGLVILAVTLLTHLDDATLEELDLGGGRLRRAVLWADLAQRGGAGGAVCSAHEVRSIRERVARPFVLVTPGIRWVPGAADLAERARNVDDQRNVAGPRAALEAGADFLVIGRPLTRAEDPGVALEDLERQLRGQSDET